MLKNFGARVALVYIFELCTSDDVEDISSYIKYSRMLYVGSGRLFVLDLWGL